MSEHIDNRRKLRAICGVQEFNQLTQQCILSDVEVEILRLHYLKGKDLMYIADTLGYSEQTIKTKHQKILKKLSHFL